MLVVSSDFLKLKEEKPIEFSDNEVNFNKTNLNDLSEIEINNLINYIKKPKDSLLVLL